MNLATTVKASFTATLFFLLLLAFPSLQAQEGNEPEVILDQDSRKKVITAIDAILNSANEAAEAKIKAATNPFEIYQAPVETEADVNQDVPDTFFDPSPRPQIDRLSDNDALLKIAPGIRPKGAIVKGSTSYLMLGNGQLIPQGTEIPATVRGEDYVVIVESISMSGYTLRINDAEVLRTFLQTSSKNTIQRN